MENSLRITTMQYLLRTANSRSRAGGKALVEGVRLDWSAATWPLIEATMTSVSSRHLMVMA